MTSTASRPFNSAYSREQHLMKGDFPQVAIQAGGTPIGPDATPRQAFAAAGADFRVEPRPLATNLTPENDDDATWQLVPTHRAMVRTDTNATIGVVGRNYTPVQNESLIQLFEYLREDAKIDNIVLLHGGRRVFATATIGIEGEVIPGDKIRRHLHAFNSHDGSTALGVGFFDLRIRCTNQFGYLFGRGSRHAQSQGHGLVMRHTQRVEEFAARLPQLINLETRSFQQEIKTLKPLTTAKLTTEGARAILEATYFDKLATPIKDKESGKPRARTLDDLDTEIGTIRSHAFGSTGIGIDTSDRSIWNLFQAITQYETHDTGRSTNEVERARARLESLFGGPAAKRIARAREACLALV
jgi:hypothetical protein